MYIMYFSINVNFLIFDFKFMQRVLTYKNALNDAVLSFSWPGSPTTSPDPSWPGKCNNSGSGK